MDPNIVGIIITTLVGCVGIFLLSYELYTRRKIMICDLNFQKEKFEKEEAFRTKQLHEQQEWLNRETVRITEVGARIADQIVIQLKRDVNWASEALEKAKIKPRAQTLFADRLGHFREEKEYLADSFIPLLFKRCKTLIENNHIVYVIIDAGTTLYPFFERIGRETTRYFENKEEWIDNLVIATNNLPGIDNLMDSPYAVIFKGCNFCNSEKADCNALI